MVGGTKLVCIIHVTHVRVQVFRFKITFWAIPGGAGSVPDITMLPNMPVSPKESFVMQ